MVEKVEGEMLTLGERVEGAVAGAEGMPVGYCWVDEENSCI
jgi:hypothetical protein